MAILMAMRMAIRQAQMLVLIWSRYDITPPLCRKTSATASAFCRMGRSSGRAARFRPRNVDSSRGKRRVSLPYAHASLRIPARSSPRERHPAPTPRRSPQFACRRFCRLIHSQLLPDSDLSDLSLMKSGRGNGPDDATATGSETIRASGAKSRPELRGTMRPNHQTW